MGETGPGPPFSARVGWYERRPAIRVVLAEEHPQAVMVKLCPKTGRPGQAGMFLQPLAFLQPPTLDVPDDGSVNLLFSPGVVEQVVLIPADLVETAKFVEQMKAAGDEEWVADRLEHSRWQNPAFPHPLLRDKNEGGGC